MHPDEHDALSNFQSLAFNGDDLEGPRVTELPLVGDYLPLRLPRLERVDMNDVLWFSPHPPPIESAEIPEAPEDDERPSIAPMAVSVMPIDRKLTEPSRVSRLRSSINPMLTMGVLAALAATAYFVQPQRHGIPLARLALAFPDRFVIDMTEAQPPLAVEDLPVAAEVDASPIQSTAGPSSIARMTKPAVRKPGALMNEGTGPRKRFVELPAVAPSSALNAVAPDRAPLPPFDSGNALTAIHAAAGSAQSCVPASGPSAARVSVTFAPNGRVTQATIVSGPLAGTNEGGCVARTLRSTRMDPYAGPPVTVYRTVRLR